MRWIHCLSGVVFGCAVVFGSADLAKADGVVEGEVGEVGEYVVVMRDQVDRAVIEHAARIDDRSLRRDVVVDLLKDHAALSQTGVLDALRDGGGVERVRSMWIANLVAVRMTEEMANRIGARGDVVDVFRMDRSDRIGSPIPVVDDDDVLFAPADGQIDCGVDLMRAPGVWDELGETGGDVVVAVIDTGCCVTHPDLVNQIWMNPGEIPGNHIDDDDNGFIDDVYGWNFEEFSADITDFTGHGTHVSGTIAGDGTNGVTTGMAPDVKIMTLKFYNSVYGEVSVWDSIQYATDNGADVINGSIGWSHYMYPQRSIWRLVCENAMAAGLVVVFSGGAEGCFNPPDDIVTPGDVPDVVTAGTLDCDDQIMYFSSCGPVTWEDVDPFNDWPYPPGKMKPTSAVPGVNTISCSNDGEGYVYMSGSAMATAHFSGAAALVVGANPVLDPAEVKDILMETAVDLGDPGMDNTYGAGRVDAFEAVLAAFAFGSELELVGPEEPGVGEVNEFVCGGAEPGNTVALLYSFSIGSTDWPACPGVAIDLNQPKIGQIRSANGSGTAVFSVYVPHAASGIITYQEAVEPDTCAMSNVVVVHWP